VEFDQAIRLGGDCTKIRALLIPPLIARFSQGIWP